MKEYQTAIGTAHGRQAKYMITCLRPYRAYVWELTYKTQGIALG